MRSNIINHQGRLTGQLLEKNLLTDKQKKVYGQYPELGKKIHDEIRGSKLVELEGVGHIPHVQEFEKFKEALFGFL